MIITETTRLRQRICETALKIGVTKTAIKYKTSRQNIYRWLKRYDGTVQSLLPKSRRPKSHPNQHTVDEIELIKKMYKRYKRDSYAEIYEQCRKRGYKRSFSSLCMQIKKHIKRKESGRKSKKKNSKTGYKPTIAKSPGERVQIDIKYVPIECICFKINSERLYQITAIDEYSRKRVCKIVGEKSSYETGKFLSVLEKEFGFKIKTVQTDNGREFINDSTITDRKTHFQKVAESLGIGLERTAPYSPWQNGKVERSHREDGEKFYNRRFKSLEKLITSHQRYVSRQNNVHRRVLKFKTPNQMVKEYFSCTGSIN